MYSSASLHRLAEGGTNLAEETPYDERALLLAALEGRYCAMRYLLEQEGAPITESDSFGETVWSSITLLGINLLLNFVELSSLLKVMVMLDDAPADVTASLLPQHAAICTNGRRLRAQLPSYLEQQRTTVVTLCPLPGVLQTVFAAYAATTQSDMWADGLRVQVSRAKRSRTKADHVLIQGVELTSPMKNICTWSIFPLSLSSSADITNKSTTAPAIAP
jgi:hypothetical protein